MFKGILQDILNASKVTQDDDMKNKMCKMQSDYSCTFFFFWCYHTASVHHCYERYLFPVKPRQAEEQFCVPNQEFFYPQIVFFLFHSCSDFFHFYIISKELFQVVVDSILTDSWALWEK